MTNMSVAPALVKLKVFELGSKSTVLLNCPTEITFPKLSVAISRTISKPVLPEFCAQIKSAF